MRQRGGLSSYGKIKEFLEFGDPRRRGALFRYLEREPNGSSDIRDISAGGPHGPQGCSVL
jgi:hypothetical protein